MSQETETTLNVTRISIVAIATLLAIGWGTVQAKEVRFNRNTVQPPAAQLTIGGGGVHDTCTESNGDDQEQCDPDQLAQRCDDAGGGMSSEPGGGIDCDLGPE
jgi:hypothetical protein